MATVTYINTSLAKFSVPFQQQTRACLASMGIEYVAVYGQPSKPQASKLDHASLGWEQTIRNIYVDVFGTELVWQPILRFLRNSDMVIIGHENRRLANYYAQLLGSLVPARIALWGHGRNFQGDFGILELWKRYWLRKCDWWFTYTDQCGEYIASCGFPRDRITVFHNAVDTRSIARMAETVTDLEIEAMRTAHRIISSNVGIYIGGLYSEKRLEFLLTAAVEIRKRVVDFELIVAGSGPQREIIQNACAQFGWIHYVGPKFDREKVILLKIAKAFLIPGLVGLAVLDASAAGLPVVTTAFPYHSPEIAYIESGINGVIVQEWNDPVGYASAVSHLLTDEEYRLRLSDGAIALAKDVTVERMVADFCRGVSAALEAPRLPRF